jgi:hypothetical protein
MSQTSSGRPTVTRASLRFVVSLLALLLLALATPADSAAYLSRIGASFGPDGTAQGLFPDAPTELALRPVNPLSLAVGPSGNVYVLQGTLVREFDAGGEPLGSWDTVAFGVGRPRYAAPFRLAAHPGGVLYLADAAQGRILKLSAAGELLASWPGHGDGPDGSPGRGLCPSGLATDARGNVYATCSTAGRFEKLSPAGTPLLVAPSCLRGPIAAGADGGVFVTSCEDVARVLQYAPDGSGVRVIGRPRLGGDPDDAAEGEFGPWQPPDAHGGIFGGASGLTVDPGGILWVADPDNDRFQGFRVDGGFVAACSPREFKRIDALAAAPNGALYATDHARVQRFVESAQPTEICDSRWRGLVLGGGRLRVSPRNTVDVRLRCLAAAGSCAGTVVMRSARRVRLTRDRPPRIVRLGRAGFRLRADMWDEVTLRLSGRGAALVRGRGRIRVRVSAVGRTKTGAKYGRSATVLLAATRRAPRRRSLVGSRTPSQ